MRNTIVALALIMLTGCGSEPAEAELFEPCVSDEDCDPRWSCVPGISGPGGPRFCSEECTSGPGCAYAVDGERNAAWCLPYPGEERSGACYQSCPDEGASPDDGCDAFGVTSRHWFSESGIDYCVCSP